jgi:hypothetical protein
MNRNPRNILMLSQISDSNPFKKTLVPRIFDIGSDFEKDMEAVGLSGKSREWRQEQAQDHRRRALRDWRDAQKELKEHIAKTDEMDATTRKMPAGYYDKTDRYGADLRREMRDRSVLMTPGQRAAKLTGPHRSIAFIDSALEHIDDPWMSGIDIYAEDQRQIFEIAKQERLQEHHAAVIPVIAERRAIESAALMPVNTIRGDIAIDSGLPQDVFEAEAKRIETKAGAPWLMDDGKTICEVVNGVTSYHQGSEDELRDAKKYPGGAAEFLAARAAA